MVSSYCPVSPPRDGGQEEETGVLLEIQGLTKRYRRGATPANDGIDLTIEAGQVYGLLGHNGAGKTTS